MRYVDFTREAFDLFKSLPRDRPISMLNLLRFRERAEYEAGFAGALDCTGEEAYAAYSRAAWPTIKSTGARVVWRGRGEATLVGAPDEKWDLCLIVEYPDAGGFFKLVTNEDYRANAAPHRRAALLDARLVRFEAETGQSL